MNQFSEMEWNSKWDWENLVAFGSKAIESPKKRQLTDWMIVDEVEIDAGSFNLSAGGGNSGASGSDGGHVSSAKSSISASTTDSSTKDGMQMPNFTLMSFSGNFSDKVGAKGDEISRTSLQADAYIGSLEPLIGLKLGKRTYFENSSAGGNVKTPPIPVMPTPSNTLAKKTKLSSQNLPVPRCLAEGCNIDLSSAKEYHRKHRVCDAHSKCPKVIVGGMERRFCQQCSRFHSLSEFDGKKRSCRRRLSDHNARRRKPPQETVQFNSARLPSPFCEGRQQVGFLLNNSSYIYSQSPHNTWNSPCNSKFTITKGYPLKDEVDGSNDCLMQVPGMKLQHIINMQDNSTNGLLAPKNSIPEASNPGSKGSSMISSNVDAALDYRRALSLLSSNTWGSESIPPVHHLLHENCAYITQPSIQQSALPEGISLSPLDVWLNGHHHHHQATHPRPQQLPANNNFQEIQLFKTPYEADFYSNIL